MREMVYGGRKINHIHNLELERKNFANSVKSKFLDGQEENFVAENVSTFLELEHLTLKLEKDF